MCSPKILLTMKLGSRRINNLMVEIVGAVGSERNKLLNFMSYNPFLQTKGIMPKADQSILMLTTSKSSVKTIYYYDIFILYCFYIQMSLVIDSFLRAQFISPHFIALDKHNFQYCVSSLIDNNIFSFFHFSFIKIGVARKSTKEKSRRPVFHRPKKPRKITDMH